MQDKKGGFWFTTKTGKHVHVEEGETPKQAAERRLKANKVRRIRKYLYPTSLRQGTRILKAKIFLPNPKPRRNENLR